MYICLCNALTDHDIRQAAAADGARRPAEVFAACRCRAQCGTCVKSVCALVRTVLGDPAAGSAATLELESAAA